VSAQPSRRDGRGQLGGAGRTDDGVLVGWRLLWQVGTAFACPQPVRAGVGVRRRALPGAVGEAAWCAAVRPCCAIARWLFATTCACACARSCSLASWRAVIFCMVMHPLAAACSLPGAPSRGACPRCARRQRKPEEFGASEMMDVKPNQPVDDVSAPARCCLVPHPRAACCHHGMAALSTHHERMRMHAGRPFAPAPGGADDGARGG